MKNFFLMFLSVAMILCLHADDVDDFMSARSLFERRKWAAASEAFIRLSETLKGNHRDLALNYAARACLNLKKRAEAEQLIAKIASPSIRAYADMEKFVKYREWKAFIGKYEKEDLTVWPEDIRYLGHFLRGEAWYRVRRYENAKADFLAALKEAGSDRLIRIKTLNFLQDIEFSQKNYEQALEFGSQIITMKDYKGFYAYLSSALQNVKILLLQGKAAEAEKLLDVLNSERKKWNAGVWYFQYLEARGDVQKALGKTDEAGKFYQQAMAVKNVHSFYRQRVEKKIKSLPAAQK